MDIFIISKTHEGDKQPIAAFTKKEKMEEYLSKRLKPQDDTEESPEEEIEETESASNNESAENSSEEKDNAAEAEKPSEEYVTEPFDVPLEEYNKLDKVYIAYLQNEGDTTRKFLSFHTNKFKALTAVYSRGVIDMIDVNPNPDLDNEDEEVEDEANQTESAQKSKSKGTRFEKAQRTRAPLKPAEKHFREQQKKQFKLLFLLIVVFFTAAYFSLFRSSEYGIVENVSSVEWLPESCTGISYFLAENIKAVQFKTTEAGYREFAEMEGLNLRTLSNEPTRIKSYLRYSRKSMDPFIKLDEQERQEKWEEVTMPTVEDGLIVTGQKTPEPDLKVEGLYDRVTGMGYFWSHRKVPK